MLFNLCFRCKPSCDLCEPNYDNVTGWCTKLAYLNFIILYTILTNTICWVILKPIQSSNQFDLSNIFKIHIHFITFAFAKSFYLISFSVIFSAFIIWKSDFFNKQFCQKVGKNRKITSEKRSNFEIILDCADRHHKCAAWAAMGHCTRNRFWMEENCRLTCTNCYAHRGIVCGDQFAQSSPAAGVFILFIYFRLSFYLF